MCIIVVGSAAHDLHLPPLSRPTINHGRLEPLHHHQEPASAPEPEPSNPTLNIVQYSQEPVPGPNPTYVDHPPQEPVPGPGPIEVTDPPPGELVPQPAPGPVPGEIIDHPPLEPIPGPEPGEIPYLSPGPVPPVPPNRLSSFFGSFYSRPHAAGAPTHA